jgi:hypothetical protein
LEAHERKFRKQTAAIGRSKEAIYRDERFIAEQKRWQAHLDEMNVIRDTILCQEEWSERLSKRRDEKFEAAHSRRSALDKLMKERRTKNQEVKPANKMRAMERLQSRDAIRRAKQRSKKVPTTTAPETKVPILPAFVMQWTANQWQSSTTDLDIMGTESKSSISTSGSSVTIALLEETKTALTVAQQTITTHETQVRDVRNEIAASREREQQLRCEYQVLSDEQSRTIAMVKEMKQTHDDTITRLANDMNTLVTEKDHQMTIAGDLSEQLVVAKASLAAAAKAAASSSSSSSIPSSLEFKGGRASISLIPNHSHDWEVVYNFWKLSLKNNINDYVGRQHMEKGYVIGFYCDAIERVHNPMLEARYDMTKARLKYEAATNVSSAPSPSSTTASTAATASPSSSSSASSLFREVWAFHGTRPAVIEPICNNGT